MGTSSLISVVSAPKSRLAQQNALGAGAAELLTDSRAGDVVGRATICVNNVGVN